MRIMIDECMAPKASRLLVGLLKVHKPPIESHFLEDYVGGKGVADQDWTKLLQNEGNWCVITCDHRKPRGQKSRLQGPPLQLILPVRRITGFFLGGSLASISGFEKVRAVIYTFPELWSRAQTAVPGTRFKITRVGAESGYKLWEWPLTSPLPTMP